MNRTYRLFDRPQMSNFGFAISLAALSLTLARERRTSKQNQFSKYSACRHATRGISGWHLNVVSGFGKLIEFRAKNPVTADPDAVDVQVGGELTGIAHVNLQENDRLLPPRDGFRHPAGTHYNVSSRSVLSTLTACFFGWTSVPYVFA
jgi:hypothetical protein